MVVDESVGAVPNTTAPLPVSFDKNAASFAEVLIELVERNPSVPVALHARPEPVLRSMNPLLPAEFALSKSLEVMVKLVVEAFVSRVRPLRVVDASVGAVPNTRAPEPVSSVTSAATSAEVLRALDAMRPLNEVQSAAVIHPCTEPDAVSQLSVFALQVRPVPSVIRTDGVT